MKRQHQTSQYQDKPDLTIAHIRIDLWEQRAETGEIVKTGKVGYTFKYAHGCLKIKAKI